VGRVTITKRRGSWFGSDAADLDEYLRAFVAGGYAVQQVVHAKCAACGESGFSILLDDEAGVAIRRCSRCAASHVMLAGARFLDEADLGEAACPGGHEQFDVAVGFALFEDGEIRWVSVGLRCQRDGLLGVYVDWKIDYSPSKQLLAQS